MTAIDLSISLFGEYEKYCLEHLRPANCKHSTIIPELKEIVKKSNGLISAQQAGTSLEGRSILRLTLGTGPAAILLWSQMHGDEPTATLALMDMFTFLVRNIGKPWVQEMLGRVAIHVIPLLNPDGAERFRRFTAAEIDMNRDARALATPEARVLRSAQRELRPAFGFNLHDQGVSSVGMAPRVTAVSLLAPAVDEARTVPPVRDKAMHVGALVAQVLGRFADGNIATYDDAFEPRAFGDNMQSWGTSTLLIESGQWPGDPDKSFIRKLNFVGILTSLHAISNGSYQNVDMKHYTQLVQNGKRAFDIIVRNMEIARNGWSERVDIGLLGQPQNGQTSEFATDDSLFAIKEIGDLRDFGALKTIDGGGKILKAAGLTVEKTVTLDDLLAG